MLARCSATLCLILLLACASFAVADKPHIVLVMADDQGFGDTGYNGHKTVKTPHLDAMANESLVLNRFYAAAPVCSPTRASVLTGRHPFRSKVTNHGRYMRPQETTIAEEFQTAGYVTGMFGKWHVGSAQADSPVNPGNSGFDEWVIGLNFFDNNPYLSRGGRVERIKGPGSKITIDETIAFLDKHKNSDQPMFAIAWFPSPHSPHQEKPTKPNMYAGVDGGGYFAEITRLDEEVGRLRAALRKLGISDNTILWYCSDNGGLRTESSGGRAKKGSIYEGGLRVPGLIEWPAKFKPGQLEIPATTSDMLPTLLAIAGVERSGKLALDGQDLSAAMSGQPFRRDRGIGFWHGLQGGQSTWSDRILADIMKAQQAGRPTPFPERLKKDIEQYPQFSIDKFPGHAAWLDWPWKLHRVEGKAVGYELYNLAADPQEATNLIAAPEQRKRVAEMQQALAAWQQSVIQSLNGEDYATR